MTTKQENETLAAIKVKQCRVLQKLKTELPNDPTILLYTQENWKHMSIQTLVHKWL